MKKVLNVVQSRELEKRAVEAGTSYLQLMENAGAAAVRFLCGRFSPSGKNVTILCGKGNNGGDGLVAARLFCAHGAAVSVVMAEGLPATEMARTMFARLRSTTAEILRLETDSRKIFSRIAAADLVIDAVYGTGFHGAVKDAFRPLFEAVDRSGAKVVSIDMPSGANCESGAVEGACIKADCTLTFSTLKSGHFFSPARNFCGRVSVLPIGIGEELIEKQEASFSVTERDEASLLFRPRDPEGNKGDYGRLLCLCGSEGMAGAAAMSAAAAARCGAGLVDVALPRPIYPIVASRIAEPVFTLLDYLPAGKLSVQSMDRLFAVLSGASACLVGCGLGQSEAVSDLLTEFLPSVRVPLILDADGINFLSRNIDIWKRIKTPVVLTPHPGEMARLCGVSVGQIQADRLTCAKRFAREHHAVLVLKGAGTVIAAPDGTAFFNPTGNAGMAKGGSGDVLAGMIASFAAQGIDPLQAAVGAVYLHGAAGDLCAQKLTQTAMLPTDLIGLLPKLFRQFSGPGPSQTAGVDFSVERGEKP